MARLLMSYGPDIGRRDRVIRRGEADCPPTVRRPDAQPSSPGMVIAAGTRAGGTRLTAGDTEIPVIRRTLSYIGELLMMIPLWWAVVAFILGGTFGVLGLAVFSGLAGGDEFDMATSNTVGQLR